ETVNSPAEEIRRWRAPRASGGWWVIAAVGGGGELFGLNAARGAMEGQARRAALLERGAGEAGTLGPRGAGGLDLGGRWGAGGGVGRGGARRGERLRRAGVGQGGAPRGVARQKWAVFPRSVAGCDEVVGDPGGDPDVGEG